MAELHSLSKLPRTGWLLAGVENAETVAIHCYETAIFAYLLSRQMDEEVDIGKVLLMALFHEVGETRLADLPRRAAPYIKEAKNDAEERIAADVLDGLADDLPEILHEFHERKTLEARLAEAAEELQIIFAAAMYAKESNGDMSEYRRDAAKYDSYGIESAEAVGAVVRDRIESYTSGKPYWEIGYRRRA
ncbi:MAG: HD domain-containing protein [Actinomycetota bacterium]